MSERRLQSPLPEQVARNQRRASDPAAHVWVTANAGSGKTHVLTRRVLRLLLAGVSPQAILCLTYTKAAAAEMRRRVSAHLGRWAVASEADLVRELADTEGRPPTPVELRRARTLFAHALETPGGLRIQTVHAFCESLLHRFPLEAGVPFDFAVLEEHERANMVLAAREAVLSGGLNGDPELAESVETLFDLLSDFTLGEAIDSALGEARRLRAVLADRAGAKARLRSLVRYDASETLAALEREILDGHPFAHADYRDILAACPPAAGGTRFEDKVAAMLGRPLTAEALFAAFLTKSLAAPKNFPTKALRTAVPHLADALGAEAQRLEGLCDRRRRAELVARSEALIDVLGAIDDRYQAQKRARSLLDFDDLIARTVALLEEPALGPWVRYKLDAGIDHVLVDESQDTNSEQWKVIQALAGEFFVGESAASRPRTIFAVGDVKQSIFSFQGAEPKLFLDAGKTYAARATSIGAEFRKVPLTTSFRTLPGILAAVDLVFGQPGMAEALLEAEPHDTARADGGGTVTLWPPVQQIAEDPVDEWPTTVQPGEKSAARRVAERIAREIEAWVRGRRLLAARGRPVRFDDVLILVQARNALFREIIRALHQRAIPTPGADRLEVTGHIAVLDLLALGDVVLNPRDDLQLAALLRSPLYDVSEDDLFAVAHARERTLWEALRDAPQPSLKAACEELRTLRRSLDAARPFEFYAHVLYARGGLRRFHARFGGEVDDLFSEFLDLALQHEQEDQPTLQGFLAAMRAREVEIRRELSEAGAGVRVMTVHGAKGLEAPIVILADAAGKPLGRQIQKPVYVVETESGATLVHASKADTHVPETDGFRLAYEAAQKAEYWRKLYVGMTRAEDELYVTGTLTASRAPEKQLEDTWYQRVEQALRPAADVIADESGAEVAIVYPAGAPASTFATGEADAAGASSEPYDPGPPPPARLVETIRPSAAHAPADETHVLETAVAAAVDADTARQRGIALHALLQHLSRVPPEDRGNAGRRALETLLPADPGAGELLDRAMRILGKPELAEVFGPQSRAEVPFLAEGKRRGTPVRFAGRIDRLVVTPERCLIVDFKSDALPAPAPAAVKEAYATQLGLYALLARELFPGRRIEAAILWTSTESLMLLPAALLREAVDGFTMA